MIKEYGLLFQRAIGLQFRNQVIELVCADHQLRAIIDPLLSIHEHVCQQQTNFDEEVRCMAKVDETTRRLMTELQRNNRRSQKRRERRRA